MSVSEFEEKKRAYLYKSDAWRAEHYGRLDDFIKENIEQIKYWIELPFRRRGGLPKMTRYEYRRDQKLFGECDSKARIRNNASYIANIMEHSLTSNYKKYSFMKCNSDEVWNEILIATKVNMTKIAYEAIITEVMPREINTGGGNFSDTKAFDEPMPTFYRLVTWIKIWIKYPEIYLITYNAGKRYIRDMIGEKYIMDVDRQQRDVNRHLEREKIASESIPSVLDRVKIDVCVLFPECSLLDD